MKRNRSILSYNAATSKVDIKDVGLAYTGHRAPLEESIKQIVPDFSMEKFRSALGGEQSVPESVMPDPNAIMYVPFRLISATMVGAGTWKATDFSNEEVLRASVSLLNGKGVYSEHYERADLWLGRVAQTTWTDRYNQNGINVPAGIDGVLAIDTTTERGANIAKGIALNAVVSNSVSVEFEWVPSHDFGTDDWADYRFEQAIGQIVDGRMVCRVVTRIIKYTETSIVSNGADEFAKKIDQSGNLVGLDRSVERLEQFSATDVAGRLQFLKELNERTKLEVTPEKDAMKAMLSMSSRFNEDSEKPKEETPAVPMIKQIAEQAIAGLLKDKHYSTKGEIYDKLSDVTGLSTRTIRNYLSGGTCPDKMVLEAMAAVLMLDKGALVAACEQDGCNYTVKQELIDQSNAPTEKQDQGCPDDDDDEEDEMKAGSDKKDDKDMMEEKDKKEDMAQQNAAISELTVRFDAVKQANDKLAADNIALAQSLKSVNTTLEELRAALSNSEKKIAELNAEKASMEPFVQVGKEQMAAIRDEAIRLYVADLGNNAQEYMINLMKKSNDVDFLNAQIASFGAKMMSKFTTRCKSCGGTEVEFASIVSGEKEQKPFTVEQPVHNPTEFTRSYRK